MQLLPFVNFRHSSFILFTHFQIWIVILGLFLMLLTFSRRVSQETMHCIQTQPRRSDQKSPVYTLNLNAHISIIIYHPWIRRHPPDAEAHLCWKTRRRLRFLVELFVKWIMKIRLNLCFLWSVAKTRHWDWATHWSVSCRRSAPEIVSTLPSALYSARVRPDTQLVKRWSCDVCLGQNYRSCDQLHS